MQAKPPKLIVTQRGIADTVKTGVVDGKTRIRASTPGAGRCCGRRREDVNPLLSHGFLHSCNKLLPIPESE